MKMGIERVLKEKFGKAVKDIRQVYDEEASETTVEVSQIIDTNKLYVKVMKGQYDRGQESTIYFESLMKNRENQTENFII